MFFAYFDKMVCPHYLEKYIVAGLVETNDSQSVDLGIALVFLEHHLSFGLPPGEWFASVLGNLQHRVVESENSIGSLVCVVANVL
jgi:hypothetical protein